MTTIPKNYSLIGTKCVFTNKLDESRNVVTKKSRLVVNDYNHEEGNDYDGTFAPIVRLEVIKMLVAFASFMVIKLYQMDVKYAFLNGYF